MPTIAITGARGFLGTVLCEYFSTQGYAVRRFVRDPRDETNSYRFDLESGFDSAGLEGVDVLIHAAHDFTPITREKMDLINVEGARKLFKAAAEFNIPKIIFVSSVSAFTGCASLYGNAKLEIEGLAAQCGGKSVRPGIIYGRKGKGIFGALERVVTKFPIVPLFDGGNQSMVLTQVDDLAVAIGELVAQFDTYTDEPMTLANPEQISFKEILKRMADTVGTHPYFIPVPGSLAMFGLRTFESIGIRLPFRSDSLISLLNANPKLEIKPEFAKFFRKFEAPAP